MSPGEIASSPFNGPQDTLENFALARDLEETADLLQTREEDRFRVMAYRRAAGVVRSLDVPVREIHGGGGLEALSSLPHIGEGLAKAIETWLNTGSIGIQVRLREEKAKESVLESIPGMGPKLARRICEHLGELSLEDLEMALHDGRLSRVPGLGRRRLRMIEDHLEARLAHLDRPPEDPPPGAARRGVKSAPAPGVGEILDVDREYREGAASGKLPRLAPRRWNPTREPWLPVLHARRGAREYRAIFSNTARAHELGRTRDWVIVAVTDGRYRRQWTVVTESQGDLAGKRVVRGRERECLEHYVLASNPERRRETS
ncbi:MAG TPA: helix-hairpin-helix domain-containing protein [Planctomycetota bacterium]|nr:helix-hairpin-helix domain-containing protein [Planctomycetota bacterium]